jgi:hypothetical protein
MTLHDGHTYASSMIAAGVNPKALQTVMRHANISITLDRYGHLKPGSEEQAAERARHCARSPRDDGATMWVLFSDPTRPAAPAKFPLAPRFQFFSHG